MLPIFDLRADRSARASPCLATKATAKGTKHISRPRGCQIVVAMAITTPASMKTADTLAQILHSLEFPLTTRNLIPSLILTSNRDKRLGNSVPTLLPQQATQEQARTATKARCLRRRPPLISYLKAAQCKNRIDAPYQDYRCSSTIA